MSPEYKAYIPPESIEAFEAFVSNTDGAKILRKRPIKKDFPQPIKQDRMIEMLALEVRETIDKLPADTLPRDLYPNYGISYGSGEAKTPRRGLPEEWFKLHMTLNRKEKTLVSKAIRALWLHRLTLETARVTDWESLPHVRMEGPITRDLLKRIFSN